MPICTFALATNRPRPPMTAARGATATIDRKSTRLNSSHVAISSAPVGLSTLSLHDALPISNGVPQTGLSGSASSERFFRIDVPAGASDLEISMSGGTGDADMYVRIGDKPTTSTYDCRPWRHGNNRSEEHTSELQSRGHLVCPRRPLHPLPTRRSSDLQRRSSNRSVGQRQLGALLQD